ncbi:MAG: biosynthetic arginine decarboxylase [Lentisphaerae bacterium]|nr:biosynthetic arginine decarboxylase [Lentisphaerota bacterium]
MPTRTSSIERWTCERSADLYGIREWGSGYYGVNTESGEVEVTLQGEEGTCTISLMDVVAGLKARGLGLPVLLRFGDILDTRIAMVNTEFQNAIRDAGYRGEYRGVYPIKVNQQQQVIEEITRFGKRYHHGLEAGSKAELIAALAYLDDPEAFLVCNGYKDEEFVDLALYGQKMGVRTVLVLEMPGELPLILRRAAALGVRPRIGVRMKPTTRASGHWNDSGGDRSVFGLNAAQLIDVVDQLRQAEMLDCLQLLHYHLGSQLPNIRDIRRGVGEACRVYNGLVQEGAPMGLLDVGGGLAVDYDGSHTNFGSSRNYTISEYCSDIVEVVMSTCDEQGIPHPTLISESGRALVAYYSVLIFNILDTNEFRISPRTGNEPHEEHELLKNMMQVRDDLTVKNAQECLHDLLYYRDEVRARFEHGGISLRQRAVAEQLFWTILSEIGGLVPNRRYVPEELAGLADALTDIYYANFSVFQSLPDAWAIDQLFPIMPIHRLGERPTRQAILSDITCDCDGKIDRFIDLHDVKGSLPLHPLKAGEDYVLGAFLVGAYQETLGDLHNLLGDTHVVTVRCNGDGEVEFSREIEGDSVADVLAYVEYDPKLMADMMRLKAERAVRSGVITPRDRREILEVYQNGLRGYTYYEL